MFSIDLFDKLLQEYQDNEEEIKNLKILTSSCMKEHIKQNLEDFKKYSHKNLEYDDIIQGCFQLIEGIGFFENKNQIIDDEIGELLISTRSIFNDYKIMKETLVEIDRNCILSTSGMINGFGIEIKMEQMRRLLKILKKIESFCLSNHSSQNKKTEVDLLKIYEILRLAIENYKIYNGNLIKEYECLVYQYKHIYNDFIAFKRYYEISILDVLTKYNNNLKISQETQNLKLYEYYMLTTLNKNIEVKDKTENRNKIDNIKFCISLEDELIMSPFIRYLMEEIIIKECNNSEKPNKRKVYLFKSLVDGALNTIPEVENAKEAKLVMQ